MTDPFMEELLQASSSLRGAPSWTLLTHQNIDGDAVGSASALFEAGVSSGKRVSWAGPDPELPIAYRFLAHTGDYEACPGTFAFDRPDELYVFLDCSNEARSVDGAGSMPEGTKVLNIDHQADNSRFGTVDCVDPSSSSTSELVFRILKAGGWPLSQTMAESVYVGIWTDSGGFSFSNTSPRTHRLAAELMELGVDPARIDSSIGQTLAPKGVALWARALSHVRIFGPEGTFAISWLSRSDFDEVHASSGDTEGLSNSMMRIRGVRLSAFLREQEDGEIKASFRSREGIFAAADVARALGGGGHARAAGATLHGSLDAWLEDLPQELERRYAEWAAADR